MNYEQLFLSQMEVIDRVIRFVVRRRRLTTEEAEEFQSIVRLKLIENDYEILRRFQHRSSLQTYLTVVIQRLFLDYRISLWGKWRPSAEARRSGPDAVRLEMLLVRDGLTFDEACEVLMTSRDVAVDRSELEAIAAKLPARTTRRFVGEEALEGLPASDGGEVERAALRGERQDLAARLRAALDRAMAALDCQDRLVLQMRFEQGLTVAQIAGTMRLDQKKLYRRIDRLLRDLRRALEADGFEAGAVSSLLGEIELLSPARVSRAARDPRPSISEGARVGD